MADERTSAGAAAHDLTIFISYRRSDTRADAGRLYDSLRRRFGKDQLFMDVDTLLPGQDWVTAVEAAVARCDVLLALIGDEWTTVVDAVGKRRIEDDLDRVRLEIEAALRQDKPVIPVLFDDARMPAGDELPESLQSLRRRHAMRLAHDTFRYDIEPLIHSLRVIETAKRQRLGLSPRAERAPTAAHKPAAAAPVAPTPAAPRPIAPRPATPPPPPARSPAPSPAAIETPPLPARASAPIAAATFPSAPSYPPTQPAYPPAQAPYGQSAPTWPYQQSAPQPYAPTSSAYGQPQPYVAPQPWMQQPHPPIWPTNKISIIAIVFGVISWVFVLVAPVAIVLAFVAKDRREPWWMRAMVAAVVGTVAGLIIVAPYVGQP